MAARALLWDAAPYYVRRAPAMISGGSKEVGSLLAVASALLSAVFRIKEAHLTPVPCSQHESCWGGR